MALLRELPAFFAAVLLISATPGPAVALLVRRAAKNGFEATVPVVVGLELGLYFWIVAAGAGLAALVAASNSAAAPGACSTRSPGARSSGSARVSRSSRADFSVR